MERWKRDDKGRERKEEKDIRVEERKVMIRIESNEKRDAGAK